MKRSLHQYRVLSGIRAQRANPILVNRRSRQAHVATHSTIPISTKSLAEVEQFDRDYAFHYVQSRWFRKKLMQGEQIKLTADLLKMICDEVHEMGMRRYRKLKANS